MDKIEITWVDSRQVHGWTLLEDIDDTVCRVNTCGYLIKETQEAYTVALSVDKDFIDTNHGILAFGAEEGSYRPFNDGDKVKITIIKR